jgi:hypothetical protein
VGSHEAGGREKPEVTFEKLVGDITAEREGQVARLQPVLIAYMRDWDEGQQRLTSANRNRPAEEVAKAKKELVEKVNTALARLDLAIYRDGQSCHLIFFANASNRRGQFWLKPHGAAKPVAYKANLSDLFDFDRGEPRLGVAAPRREALAEWREREQTRRGGDQKPKRGS